MEQFPTTEEAAVSGRVEGERGVEPSAGIGRDNLWFEVARTVNPAAKRNQLRRMFAGAGRRGTGIIYVATVRCANELHRWVSDELGLRAGLYHAKLRMRDREEAQQRFMAGEYHVMVATRAFGIGIDKADIRFVVHHQFPDSLESYYQEAGRAGRDGQQAMALLLYRLEDKRVQSWFLGGKYPKREESLRGYEVLRKLSKQAGGKGVPLSQWAAVADLGDRGAKVIAAQLDATEIAERRRGRLHLQREFRDAAELDAYLRRHEQRHTSDRQRVETMMRYAESTMCRQRFLQQYFGEESHVDCGHCDNCRTRARGEIPVHGARPPRSAPHVAQPQANAPTPRGRRTYGGRFGGAQHRRHTDATPLFRPSVARFERGALVQHASFGEGEVLDEKAGIATVAFARHGTRKVKIDFLHSVH